MRRSRDALGHGTTCTLFLTARPAETGRVVFDPPNPDRTRPDLRVPKPARMGCGYLGPNPPPRPAECVTWPGTRKSFVF